MFGGAHAPVDMQRFGAHPSADELDHGVGDTGSVERGGEPGAKGVPSEDLGCRLPKQEGEDAFEQVVKFGMSVRFIRLVVEKWGGSSLVLGDWTAQHDISQGSCNIARLLTQGKGR